VPRYTDRDRRKSIETRRRNARLRREEISKLAYNPYNPTVKLTDNVVVTKEVEKRLTKKADESTSLSVSQIILIVIFNGFILTFILVRPFSAWNYIFLIPAAIAIISFTIVRQKRVQSRTNQLALERKQRLDETRQFYSSPEWKLIRQQVIKEKGRVCSECGNPIRNSYDVTVDHIRPRSKYPELALDKENLSVLCRSCNSSKGDRDSEISAFE
jgi:5-methylcytosine-specific restriction endonuclease McrA